MNLSRQEILPFRVLKILNFILIKISIRCASDTVPKYQGTTADSCGSSSDQTRKWHLSPSDPASIALRPSGASASMQIDLRISGVPLV
jgi:hypothetical protein